MQAQCGSRVIGDIDGSNIASFAADERGQSEERHFMRVNCGLDR